MHVVHDMKLSLHESWQYVEYYKNTIAWYHKKQSD